MNIPYSQVCLISKLVNETAYAKSVVALSCKCCWDSIKGLKTGGSNDA